MQCKPQYRVYGFLPDVPLLAGTSVPPPKPSSDATAPTLAATPSAATASISSMTPADDAAVAAVSESFSKHFDTSALLADLGIEAVATVTTVDTPESSGHPSAPKRHKLRCFLVVFSRCVSEWRGIWRLRRDSREEIAIAASKAGACGG